MRSRTRSCRILVSVAAFAALAALGVLAVPSAGFAQAYGCGPGQAVVDTFGHCCSPGQAWDASAGQCVNPGSSTVTVTSTTLGTPQGVGLVVPGAPLSDPNAPVAVTFAPGQPGDAETLVLQPITGAVTRCTLPCVVNLPPGYVTVYGSGQREFVTALNVPPFAPLTVQVNHLNSQAPLYALGATLTTLGVVGVVGGIVLFATNASCGTPMTPAEKAAAGTCNSANTTRNIVGGAGVSLGLAALIWGAIDLVSAASRGAHPITLMNPGQVLYRPLSQRNTGWHFAGIEPATIPGGALLRGGITF